jgi:hypothetical protein
MSSNRVGGVGTNIVVAIIGMIINIIGSFNPKILKYIQYILERDFPSRRRRSIDREYRRYRRRRPVSLPRFTSMPIKRTPPSPQITPRPKPLNNEIDLSNDKIYQKVHLDKEFTIPTKSLICSSCGNENPEDSKICKSCLNNIPKCLICYRAISAEQIVHCPFCNANYHKTEFFEWLKVKAICKNCNKELDLWEFQKYSKKHEHLEAIASIKCPKCKKLIPNDSDFCIFCGLKIKKG